MLFKRGVIRPLSVIRKIATDVRNNLVNRPQGVRALLRCALFLYICMILLTIPSVRKIFEPVEFIVVQMTIILVPLRRLGPHIEFSAIALLGSAFGDVICALSLLISHALSLNGELLSAVLFCLTTTFVVFFSMALSYSRPSFRIFSVSASLISIILPGILFSQEISDKTLFIKALYAGSSPALLSIIISILVFPTYSSSMMRTELEKGMNCARKALELLAPLIVSFPDKGQSGDIDEKLSIAKKAIEDGKASLFAMNNCRIESKYEVYRWYYSLWSYAEIQERVQVALRHLSGLIISVEVLYKAEMGANNSKEAPSQVGEERHYQHLGSSTRSESLSHVTDLLWLMLEALESSMLLLLHPTSISDPSNKAFDLEECKVDSLLSDSIRTCEDVRDDILRDLVGIVLKNAPSNTSEPSPKNNISPEHTHSSHTAQKTDGAPYSRIELDNLHPNYSYSNGREIDDNENSPGLCVFFFYFSLRQSARACLETQRSARNLYAYHVHQNRHIFWPQFFIGAFSRSNLLPRKKYWVPKIWRKGILTIPSDIIYFIRLAFSRGDVRFGIKSSLVMLLCYVWAYIKDTRDYYYRFRGQWAVISAVVTLSPTTGTTSSCMGHRMLGTLIGASWAIVVKALPNTMFFSLIGMFPFASICLYMQVFTKYAYLSRIALFGYVAVGFTRSSIVSPIQTPMIWPEDDLTSTLVLAGIRSLTVLLGMAFAIIGSYIIFPTFSRIKLRLTIARVLRSAASLLTERIAHHLRQVNESGATCINNSSFGGDSVATTGKCLDDNLCKDKSRSIQKHVTWAEAHAISHSLYKCTKRERKTRINVSLLAIHALITSAKTEIQFASEEPDLDRPFDKAIYSEIIDKCTSIVNLLSIIEGALESQVMEELDPSSLMLILWNSHYHGVASLTATMYILSHSLSMPLLQPLPACLPLGLARQDLNRIKTRLMRVIYSDPEQFMPIHTADNREKGYQNVTSAQLRESGDSPLIPLAPPSEHLYPREKRSATMVRFPTNSVAGPLFGDNFRLSDLARTPGDINITRTASTAAGAKYKTLHYINNRVAAESVAVRQAADATLKLKSKNVPPYDTLFPRTPKKFEQKPQAYSHPKTRVSSLLETREYSDFTNRQKKAGDISSESVNFLAELSRGERSFASNISLVDIYIYAYYYAVECMINEVEDLELEVERLLGREFSLEVIPRKSSFDDVNVAYGT